LNPKVEAAEELEEKTKEICEIYEAAPELAKVGIKLYSTDECTGIQAKERLHPAHLMKKGKARRVEYEYIRHGTLSLTANFEIATGQIESPTINETRTEADFVEHLKRTVENTAQATGWWFIVDQLNTHKSESLVRFVAQVEGIEASKLGEKGKRGILKSMKTRQEFLEAVEHQIRFIFTPKHCSWLNQIEIWFSILAKKLIKWGNFTSKEDLQGQLERFIEYFNQTMAKPFKWTFKGFPLRA
jgi:DDE superfamily endonuclease